MPWFWQKKPAEGDAAKPSEPSPAGAPTKPGGEPDDPRPRVRLNFWWGLTLVACVMGGFFFYSVVEYGYYYTIGEVPKREKMVLGGFWSLWTSYESPENLRGNPRPLVDYPPESKTESRKRTSKDKQDAPGIFQWMVSDQEKGERVYRWIPGSIEMRTLEADKAKADLEQVMAALGWPGQGADGAGPKALRAELEKLHKANLGIHEYRYQFHEPSFRTPGGDKSLPAAATRTSTINEYFHAMGTPRPAPFGWDLENAREIMKVLAQKYPEWEHRWKFLDVSQKNAEVARDTEKWARDELMRPNLVEWQKKADEANVISKQRIETAKSQIESQKAQKDQDRVKVEQEIQRVKEPQPATIKKFQDRISEIRKDIQKVTGRDATFYEFDYRGLDGKVIFVDAPSGFVIIDKGWADGIDRGFPFLVFRMKGGHIIPQGEIEVREVQPHVSHCRIRQMRDPTNPIMPGDLLENPLIVPDAPEPRVYMFFGRMKPVTGIPDELCRIWLRRHGNIVIDTPSQEPYWIPLLQVDYIIVGQLSKRGENGQPVEMKDFRELDENLRTFVNTAKQLGIPFIATENFLQMMIGTDFLPRDQNLLDYLRDNQGYQYQTTAEFFALYKGM